MLRTKRASWLSEEQTDGLNVFVPGLMAAGILMSIGMLIGDAFRKLVPAAGKKARAAQISLKSQGRVNDLSAIGLGVAPTKPHIERVPRRRLQAIALALASLWVAFFIIESTITAYTSTRGTLAGRGWTLTGGFSLAFVPLCLGLMWGLSVFYRHAQPAWLRQATQRWPIGSLPDPQR